MEDNIAGAFGEHIAKVIFNEPEQNLRISRWGSEFLVEIPIAIHFGTLPAKPDYSQPYLSMIRGNVCVVDGSHNNHKVGEISQIDFKVPYRQGLSQETRVLWRGHIGNLAMFEKIRNGGTPRMSLSLWGDMYYHIQLPQLPEVKLIGEPHTFWLNSSFNISKDIWIQQLRKIELLENVLVEIPLRDSPSAPWDNVWKAVTDARDAFERGGSTGWKSCIVSCRLALEEWQKIEKEDMGAGWQSPPPKDRQQRTKSQRIDNLRWHLMQLAHDSAHSYADKWDREDAVLLLSTLSALLAQRRP